MPEVRQEGPRKETKRFCSPRRRGRQTGSAGFVRRLPERGWFLSYAALIRKRYSSFLMSRRDQAPNPEVRMSIAGVLTWLLPGAGHFFIGERSRGLIIMITIALTFWGGVAIGGISNTVSPGERTLWFVGQICAGGHALAAWGIGNVVDPSPVKKDPKFVAYGRAEEVAVVYTAICGMLNVLVIFDVLVRAEKPVSEAGRAPPIAKGAAG